MIRNYSFDLAEGMYCLIPTIILSHLHKGGVKSRYHTTKKTWNLLNIIWLNGIMEILLSYQDEQEAY